MVRFIFVLLWAFLIASPALAGDTDFQDLLRQNSYDISLEDGTLVGEGAERLIQASENAQFVAIGEGHNNKDIPSLTLALFKALHDKYGFNYFAEEQDPVMMKLISKPDVRGNPDAIKALAKDNLNGFVFISDQELDMLAALGAASTAKRNPLWGCEQAFGVSHVLRTLITYAPNAEAREFTAALLEKSLAKEATRDLSTYHFIFDEHALEEDIARLEALYADVGEPEAHFLIDAIRSSFEIYNYYYLGSQGDPTGYYLNNSVREEYMKTRCLDEYAMAEKTDGSMPKVLMKFGHWHLFKGLNPGSVLSLGTFMNDFARSHGKDFLNVAIIAMDNPTKDIQETDELHFLQDFLPVVSDDKWVLVDLRPLRPYRRFRHFQETELPFTQQDQETLRRFVYGFDFFLFMNDYTPATFDVTGVEY